jgi:hypothetical protein
MDRPSDITLGPLATLGGTLLAFALLRRSWKLAAAGVAAIVADQRVPASRRFKDAVRNRAPQA